MSKMADTYYKQMDSMDGMERELYRILKTFKDNVEHTCFPSIATLMKLFKRCRNTTKAYLRKLEAKGFITIKENRVTHEVTNNKYNDTNTYTLILDKLNGALVKADAVSKQREVAELKETKIDSIIKNLKKTNNESSVDSAAKTMLRNMRNGSIINRPKNYLESLISKVDNQLVDLERAIKSSTKSTDKQSSNKYLSKTKIKNRHKTKFHNFEQRTDKYTSEELTAKVLSSHKNKKEIEKQGKNSVTSKTEIELSGLIKH